MLFYAPALLDQVEALGTIELHDEIVFRHMLADVAPSRINTRGARWNPPDVGAIYTSLSRATALAEANYHLSLQTPPLRVTRTLYQIRVSLHRVTDIRDVDVLGQLGVRLDALTSPDMVACQRLGGAVARLGHDGLIVPSIRHAGGLNLVIYPQQLELETTNFEVIYNETIAG